MSERVEATVIETDLAEITKAEQWLADARERADTLADQYTPHEIVDDADRKRSRADRSSVRKDREAIDREGRALIATVEEAVKGFKSGLKEALSKLDAIDAEYKGFLDAEEDRFRSARMADLAEEYGDYAPALAEMVPFDAIAAKYGAKWRNRSTSVVTAKKELCEACDEIANGERDIDELVSDEAERTTVKAIYFSTLDLHAATTKARELREQRERVERLERERQEWAAMAEAAQPEPKEPADTFAEPEPVESRVDVWPAEPARPYVVVVPSATRTQMRLLGDRLAEMGLSGRIVPGTLADAYEREVRNG